MIQLTWLEKHFKVENRFKNAIFLYFKKANQTVINECECDRKQAKLLLLSK